MRIVDVEPLDGYRVRLTLDNGTTRDVDLWQFISWGPIFEPLRQDPVYFRSVAVDPNCDTIVWPNGADIAPEVLLGEAEPATKHPAASGITQ